MAASSCIKHLPFCIALPGGPVTSHSTLAAMSVIRNPHINEARDSAYSPVQLFHKAPQIRLSSFVSSMLSYKNTAKGRAMWLN